jgi:uncharacterized membrane protein YgcG
MGTSPPAQTDKAKPKGDANSNLNGHLFAACAAAVLVVALLVNRYVLEPMEAIAAIPKPNDIFIVSYPKSGSTFVRLLLGHLSVNGQGDTSTQLDLQTIEDVVPDLEYGPNRRKYVRGVYHSKERGGGGRSSSGGAPGGSSLSTPRLFKSHQGFGYHYQPPCDSTIGSRNVEQFMCDCPNCPRHFQRIVYVVREARDVLCSYFHFQTKLGEFVPSSNSSSSSSGGGGSGDGDGAFSEFLRSDAEEALYPGVRWVDHVAAYFRQVQNASSGQDILLVRYEDLRDPATALDAATRVAAWAGLPSAPGAVRDALERSDFGKMRTLEEARGRKLFDRHYDVAGTDFRLTRRGVVGGWKDDPQCQLPETESRAFHEAVSPLLRKLGYSAE